jgi:pimeloyl-ACP methyl ester carboxylesterase
MPTKQAPPTRPSWTTWLLRLWIGGAVALLASVVIGVVYQNAMSARDRNALAPPGRLVDIGGRSLHLLCTGSGSPTVLLEAGNIAYSATWARVQAPLAGATRVCSYDRAGLAWSERSTGPRDGRTIARDLRRLLSAAGEAGPFVLVGHSMGALYVRSFALEFPEETNALVLVDPSHPEQFERWPEALRGQQEWGRRMMAAAPLLGGVGVLRATNLFGRLGRELPEWEYRSARHFLSSPGHLRTAAAELDAFEMTGEQLRTAALPPDLPIQVLSASEVAGSPELPAFVAGLHAELARLTDSGRHVSVEGADHHTILTSADHAAVVARYVVEMIHVTVNRDDEPGAGDLLEQEPVPLSRKAERVPAPVRRTIRTAL